MGRHKGITQILEDYHLDAATFQRRQQERKDSDVTLRKIEEQIRRLGLAQMEQALDGKTNVLIDQRMEQLEEKRKARLEKLGGRAHLCSRCADTGIVDGHYCTCLRSRIYREHYGAKDALKFPVNLETYDLSVFDDEHPYEENAALTVRGVAMLALRAAKDLVAHLPDSKLGLFIQGEPGLGKTWLASATARSAAERGIDTAIIEAVPLFNAYHRRRLGEEVDMGYIETATLLVIDDVGTEPITANVTLESFHHILAMRASLQLPTIVTTNEDENMDARYGERITSRLRGEDFLWIRLKGNDLRRLRSL